MLGIAWHKKNPGKKNKKMREEPNQGLIQGQVIHTRLLLSSKHKKNKKIQREVKR